MRKFMLAMVVVILSGDTADAGPVREWLSERRAVRQERRQAFVQACQSVTLPKLERPLVQLVGLIANDVQQVARQPYFRLTCPNGNCPR